METLLSLSSFITELFVFWAARMPPSFVAIMPSALLPVPVQIDFHFCPPAITPGISLTSYALCSGGPAGALPAPRPPPPPRWGGGVLHFDVIKSGYFAS